MSDSTKTLDLATALGDDLRALRRELHQVPEIGLDLPITQGIVLRELDGIDLEVTRGEGLSSVVAVLRGTAEPAEGERQVVLLRGDMDALPVTEEVEVDYRSRHEGQMHACGHDLHTAALLGAVRILDQLRDRLAGDVVFMFQPAEEGPGGALPMIEEGLLEAAGRRVDAAYAMHVTSSEYPLHQWFSRPQELMAAADTVQLVLRGSGGHGSQPHRANDPVPALCEVVLAWQTMVTRTVDPFDTLVLTVGSIHAGTKDNIIPETARLTATLRTFSAQTREKAVGTIRRVAEGVAAAHGLSAEVSFVDGYPATINDDQEYDAGRQAVVDLFGEDRFTERLHPQMGSEDMSFVLDEVPGAYFFISACAAPDYDHAPDNHSPQAEFDDVVVPEAAAWLAEVALRKLGGATTSGS